ncbi:MYXO-CTERM-anchored inactivated metalloprotease [Myxococcus fulvus]|uniref:MYXO-CTERM-anchored inactivated metalloprotease n=1 Tax=Myxococcus fulvus TaxID=33 RepID=UPI003BA2F542
MRPSNALLLIPLIGLLSGPTAWAQPYERIRIDKVELCRGARTVAYSMVTSAGHPTSQERAAITAAFDTWNQAAATCSDLVFVPGEDVPAPVPPPRDGRMLVRFLQVECPDVAPADDACWLNDTCAEKYDCWSFPQRDVVDETSYFWRATGEMIGTVISLNHSHRMLTTVDGPPCDAGVIGTGCVVGDIQSLVTRSIGEGVGFALLSREDSTMSRGLPWGDTRKRVIDPGTLQGLCETYPRGQPTPGCPLATDGGVPDAGDGGPFNDGGGHGEDAGTPGHDGGTADAGDGAPPGDGGAPSKSGCTTASSSVPLLGALLLLWGARRRSRHPSHGCNSCAERE